MKTFKDAVIDAWDAIISLVVINMLWVLFTVLVITAFPAFGGLYYATNRIAHGEIAGAGDFFYGFRNFWGTSWKWGLLSVGVLGLSAINVWFYGQFEGFGFVIIQSLFLSFIILFMCVQIYLYPFLLEQEMPSLRTAVKNSFSVFIGFMGRTILVFISFLILAIVSTLLPPLWLLLTASLITYFSNWQTIVIIENLREKEKLNPAE